jgi:hypothetical protein
MGKLKSTMMDIGYKAMDIGVQEASKHFGIPEDDVRTCVLFADSYDGTWTDYVKEHPHLDPYSGIPHGLIH